MTKAKDENNNTKFIEIFQLFKKLILIFLNLFLDHRIQITVLNLKFNLLKSNIFIDSKKLMSLS